MSGCDGDQHHHQLLLAAAQPAAAQMYHVPQYSRREKLRFPPELVYCLSPNVGAADAGHLLFQEQRRCADVVPSNPAMSYGFVGTTAGALGQVIPHTAAVPQSCEFSLTLSSSASNSRRPVLAGTPSGPYGPFTGYSTVLCRSRFLGPAKQLLDEICGAGARPPLGRSYDEDAASLMDPDMEPADPTPAPGADADDGSRWKATRLLSMMEEVRRRYKLYYKQIQTVISSFESEAGLRNAAPYACLALSAMSKHFKFLKSAIASQLRLPASGCNPKDCFSKDDMGNSDQLRPSGSGGSCLHQRTHIVSPFDHPQIWRPQRGLPERAVAVLRAWLFEHFLHPYPTDTDKGILAKQTGLTRSQVSNWFINARVRLWKPMVEEIHKLEMRQQQQQQQRPSVQCPSHDGVVGDPVHPRQERHKPSNADFHQLQNDGSNPDPMNFAYDNDALAGARQQLEQQNGAVANGSISLTLGLHHQNRSLCLPTDMLPANLLHRFGLENCSDPFVISFAGQDRPGFPKDMAGHLLS